jgi:hypothetical protein
VRNNHSDLKAAWHMSHKASVMGTVYKDFPVLSPVIVACGKYWPLGWLQDDISVCGNGAKKVSSRPKGVLADPNSLHCKI